MTKDGRNLDQICAGTFGAPTKELVTGTPWQYNLLKFEGVPKPALAPQAIFIFMGN